MSDSEAGTKPGEDWPGAFREPGPWRLEPERIVWRRGIAELRSEAQALAPQWAARRRLPPLGRFVRAGVSLGAAVLLWRLREGRRPRSEPEGRRLVEPAAQGSEVDPEGRHAGEASRAGLSRRLRSAFERLGPTYIKLGQIISSGRGIFPDELVREFQNCRDRVPPEPFAAVRAVAEQELGCPLERVFTRFEREPLASASIAQVHAARLPGGEDVVVKVQRPRVAERVRADVAAMAWIAPWLTGRIPVAALANPPALVDLFAETIVEELDFRLEAQNMLDVAAVLRDAGQISLVVPRPHPELVTRRILVMERLEGFHPDDIDGMRAAGIDTAAVLHSLLVAFLEGAMIYGVFHGDLHGGNLLVLPDGRVALLDHGMTGRMDETQRLAFLRMMMAGAVNDVRGQLAALRDLGALPEGADLDAVLALLKVDQPVRDPTRMSGEELIAEIRELVRGLLRVGARLPKHLMLYLKNMLFIDGATSHYAPDADLFAEMTKIYAYFAQKHGARILREIGFDPSRQVLDLTGMKASMGLCGDVESLTHRELQERRRVVRDRLEERGS